jgi:hypothetical protein
MVRPTWGLPSNKNRLLMMVHRARHLPSDEKKEIFDGTAGGKFTIRCGKGSLRWHAGRKNYHPLLKRKFAMVRRTNHLPSAVEKEVCDGTLDESFAIRCGKGSLRWYAGRKNCHPLLKRKFAMVRRTNHLPSDKEK